ncbi:MAG TPA: ABC transporter substrate-binding protein, partial [Adhaeribacter sp.]|nr:ABC transporter substrate-binding protein [Adhaeribacter sp.]
RDLRPDPEDPKKFTLICSDYSPEHLLLSGDFFVLPAYLFDPEGLLQPFTLPQLAQQFDALTKDPAIQQFAENFNSARFTRDHDFLKGSAGYLLDRWETGQQVSFVRKTNWWGNDLPNPQSHLTANPQKIDFLIKPDDAAALIALKNGQLDVWQNIPAMVFEQLRNDAATKADFQFFTPQTYTFAYLGFNGRLPKLAGRQTRQALAHLLDLDAIIALTQQNLAARTIGPVSPEDKAYYHSGIKPYNYNLSRAETLLQQDGWQKNAMGWQRKTQEGPEVLTLALSYSGSNSEFEAIALVFQQAAAKIGIPVTLKPLESGVFTKELKQGDFDLFLRSMTGNPFVFNFKPILHTSSIGPDGLNYTGFGTAKSDAIIEELYGSNAEARKTELLKRLQEILHQESNLAFLFFKRDRIAVHKRFSNLKISGIKPGYDVSAFEVKEK